MKRIESVKNTCACLCGCLFVGTAFVCLGLTICCFNCSWFISTNIKQINDCCEMEFKTTQYLLGGNVMSSQDLTPGNITSCCGNISVDDYFNQMDTTIQLNKGTSKSIWNFVQAFPFLIIIHYPMPVFCVCFAFDIRVYNAVTLSSMVLCTAVSITCVVVYATIYMDQIGFTIKDLGTGWISAAILSGYNIFHDVFFITMSIQSKEWTKDYYLISKPDWTSGKRKKVLEISAVSGPVYTDNTVRDTFKAIEQQLVETSKISNEELINFFQTFINMMWNQHLVGKDVDAITQLHYYLNVISVKPGYNDCNYFKLKYINMRHVIQNKIERCLGRTCLAHVDCEPIQTSEIMKGASVLIKTLLGMHELDSCLNEYLLFHGTSEANAEIISKSGFDISKLQRSELGKGIYFTESPVLADQHAEYIAGANTTGYMLVCRVILGNFIIRTTPPGNELRDWTNLPCRNCVGADFTTMNWFGQTFECNHLPNKEYDSLIYDDPTKMFREFVVFKTDQILVENVIKYTRVSNTVLDTRL